jgi:hypothetical protein
MERICAARVGIEKRQGNTPSVRYGGDSVANGRWLGLFRLVIGLEKDADGVYDGSCPVGEMAIGGRIERVGGVPLDVGAG